MKRAADYPENAVEQTILTPGDFGLDDIESVSYSRYTKNWRAMPPHVHEGRLELCYCRRGSLQFECAGKRHTVLPDDVFLSQPGDVHRLLTNHKGVICYWLVFRYPKPGRPALALPKDESRELVQSLRSIGTHLFAADPELRGLFKSVFRTVEADTGTRRRLKLRALFVRILLLIAESSSNAPGLRGLNRIDEIAKIIARRPAHNFSTAELAAHAKLSESRFTALFRQIVGLPPHAYLTTCRLNEARRRLKESDASVAAIAHDLGYASPQHLAVQFKRTFGRTPSECRSRRNGT